MVDNLTDLRTRLAELENKVGIPPGYPIVGLAPEVREAFGRGRKLISAKDRIAEVASREDALVKWLAGDNVAEAEASGLSCCCCCRCFSCSCCCCCNCF